MSTDHFVGLAEGLLADLVLCVARVPLVGQGRALNSFAMPLRRAITPCHTPFHHAVPSDLPSPGARSRYSGPFGLKHCDFQLFYRRTLARKTRLLNRRIRHRSTVEHFCQPVARVGRALRSGAQRPNDQHQFGCSFNHFWSLDFAKASPTTLSPGAVWPAVVQALVRPGDRQNASSGMPTAND